MKVRCIIADRHWLGYGRVYEIREVWPDSDLIAVGPNAGPREMLWYAGRFEPVWHEG